MVAHFLGPGGMRTVLGTHRCQGSLGPYPACGLHTDLATEGHLNYIDCWNPWRNLLLSLFALRFATCNMENSTFLPRSVVCKDKETYAAQFCVLQYQRLIWRVNHSKPIFHPKHPLSKEKMSYIHFTSACAWRQTGLVDGDTSHWSVQIGSPWEWVGWK